jgi:polysaccharide biosynthesis transport protein
LNIPASVVDQFDIKGMLSILRRRRGIILGTIVVLTLVATGILFALTPRYTAEGLLLLGSRKTNVIDLEAVMSGLQSEAAAIRSEADVIRSRSLAGKVIDKLGQPRLQRRVEAGGRRPQPPPRGLARHTVIGPSR